MKKIIGMLLTLALLCAALTGCGAGSDGGTDEGIDVVDLLRQMQAASDLPAMLTVRAGDENAERAFATISDLDYGVIDAYCLTYAAEGTAHEIAVFRVKDSADMGALETSLKDHIAQRRETFRYYMPEEVPRCESGRVVVHGSYAALIICDDAAAVQAVFDKAFE